MYSKEEWDNIYKVHLYDAPWMSSDCANVHIDILKPYLSNVTNKRLLDYGCGNGLIAYYFYKEGAKVELADISESLVEWLKKKYERDNIKVMQVATPQEIEVGNKGLYDIIIANSLFHHLQPKLWTSFLNGFANILSPKGLLLLSGWDKSDEFAKKRLAPYTQRRTWPITDIRRNIQCTHQFDIIDEKVQDVKLPDYFKNNKKFIYYILKKKEV